MLFTTNLPEPLIIAFIYMFLYNFTFTGIFWTLQSFINTRVKTLYSFKDLKLNFFFCSFIILTFFSLAGVPPFIGFFSKVLILLNLINSNFFFFFLFFFTILFFGLYFYVQNMKFLLSNTNEKISYSFVLNGRLSKLYFIFTFLIFFFSTFGFFFFDDVILYFSWLLSF